MHIAPHLDDEELLLALDGELDADRRIEVDAHLAACGHCEQRLSALRATLDAATAAAVLEAGEFSHRANRRRLEARLTGFEARHFDTAFGLAVAASLLIAIVWLTRPVMPGEAPRALPVASLTPGDVADLTAVQLCSGERPSRVVSEAARRQVLRDYRMEHVPDRSYELDALITPELGGTSVPANLWPQMYDSPVWNAHVKDQLEDLLSSMVCRREIALTTAQKDIAADWVAAYKHYFKTEMPLDTRVATRGPLR